VWLDVFTFTMRWLNIKLSIATSALLAATCFIVFMVKDDLPVEYAGTAIIYAVQVMRTAED
jgi:hypothetical protein